MKATNKGLLYPQLKELHVDFGNSTIKTKDVIHELILKQAFNVIKYVVMDSLNRFGKDLYNHHLSKLVAHLTNNQYHTFNWNIK